MELFDNNEEFDDFRLPEEEIAFVNESIGKVFEKELTEVERFKEDLDEQLMMSDYPKDDLTKIIVGYIQGCIDSKEISD